MADETTNDTVYDAIVIGGGPAGLAAALWLARYRRTVRLFDAQDPRNKETWAVHGYFGIEDPAPLELRAIGRQQAVNAGVELEAAIVKTVDGAIDDFRVTLGDDRVGNSRGMNGAVDNTRARVFGPGIPVNASQAELRRYLYSGGELDTPSRELMRYVDRIADAYVPNLNVMMVYRLDRFGRGGDHTPFFQQGYPAVRVTEFYEDYTRQHQNLRTENGIRYGDTPDMVDYVYTAKMAGLNAASLASLAWAPPAPDSVTIAGAVTPNTVLRWKAVASPGLTGYRVYWREPDAATWQYSRWVGNATQATLEGVVIDNYFFAVAAVGRDGHESRPVFPGPAPAR